MWIEKNNELINLTYVDNINYDICEENNQFELDFYKNGKLVSYIFFSNEKGLKNAFLNIKLALKNNKKFLEI